MKYNIVVRRYRDEMLKADIVEFRPSRDASRDFTLRVTATLSDKRTVSATYSLQVLQEWSAGAEKLRSAVNARSNQTR